MNATQSNPVLPRQDGPLLSGKHLIFSLGHEEFGLEVLAIKEFIGMQEITPVPRMPRHVKGVINLRGQVGVDRKTTSHLFG